MKKIFLKKYNRLISVVLSILGVGGACTFTGCEYGTPNVEYGVPYATYKVQGTVTSEVGAKIPGIKVILQYDTTYTDVDGGYLVQTTGNTYDANMIFLVEYVDVDGISNGDYFAADTIVSFKDAEFQNGDGSWFAGEATKTVDVKLKDKS